MGRVFWGIVGLGVCAASVILLYAYSSIIAYYPLAVFGVICLWRLMNYAGGIQDRMDGIAAILLEEEEEGQLFHPPYDIELPEDES